MLIWKTFTQGKGSAHVLLLWKLTVDQINTLQLMPHGSSTTWTLRLITKLKCFSVAAHMTCKLATVIEWTCALSFPTYSRVRNKHTPMLINFLTFFQGLRPYSGLHRAYLSSISIRYKWGYAYSFCQIFQGLRLFQTLE